MVEKKLRELRKRFDLKQKQLAEVLGIKQDAISKIEHNKRELTSFEIFKLSKKYDIPVGYFFGEINLDTILQVHYRATESLTEVDKAKIAILKKIANKYYDIEDVLKLNERKILRKYPVENIQFDYIQEIAREERKVLGFNETEPISDLYKALSSSGIKILYPILEFAINGIFLSLRNDRYLIAVNKDNSPAMRNFTLAHEYGHYLFHRNDNFNIVTTNLENPTSLIDKEKIANIFAAEFLIPEKSLDDFKISEDSLTRYLHRYKISRNALIYRLDNLKKIKPDEKNKYLRNYKPIEALERLGLDSEEVEWNNKSKKIKRLSAAEREKRKKLVPQYLLADYYKENVFKAYEKGLISYAKLADYLLIDVNELEKMIKPKEEQFEDWV